MSHLTVVTTAQLFMSNAESFDGFFDGVLSEGKLRLRPLVCRHSTISERHNQTPRRRPARGVKASTTCLSDVFVRHCSQAGARARSAGEIPKMKTLSSLPSDVTQAAVVCATRTVTIQLVLFICTSFCTQFIQISPSFSPRFPPARLHFLFCLSSYHFSILTFSSPDNPLRCRKSLSVSRVSTSAPAKPAPSPC